VTSCPLLTAAAFGARIGLRELRPRGGNSPWRALYRRIGDRMWVAAIAPEAVKDRRGFEHACRLAEARLARVAAGVDH
jgi:hypothetical protein